jgi:hypothetical protein
MLMNADGVCTQSSVDVLTSSGPVARWSHALYFPANVEASCWCGRISGLSFINVPGIASGYLRIVGGRFGTLHADIGSTSASAHSHFV